MKRRKAFTREERLIQIVQRTVMEYPVTARAKVTASEVAGWLDISATQARKLLRSLVAQGVMSEEFQPYPGICKHVVLFGFTSTYLNDVEDKRYVVWKQPKRHIKINGQQLEIGGRQ